MCVEKNLKFHGKLLSKLKLSKNIFVNNLPCSIRSGLKLGDIVSVSLDYEEENSNIVSTEMKLNIIYEDEYLLIVDKPSDIAVHPSNNHYSTSLSNGVRFYFDSIGLKKKVRIVNRLDKDTSRYCYICKK